MAQEKGADQTEKPTQKRLRDARKDGQIHKSQDLNKTLTLLVWFLLFAFLMPYLYDHIQAIFALVFQHVENPGLNTLNSVFFACLQLAVLGFLPFLLISVIATIIIEFLQVGPLLAFKRVIPKLEHLNPAEGLKKMFSRQNLVEVIKAVVKTAALVVIIYLVARTQLGAYTTLPRAESIYITLALHWDSLKIIAMCILIFFLLVSVLDVAYQKLEFTKNLMMSKRDIKQEIKDNEGDPMMKGQRRQLHQEWSQQNTLTAARRSDVLVVNPTHVAVAIQYTPEITDLPIVTAKSEGDLARRMREAAEQSGVPVIQNIELARGLFAEIEVDHFITSEFFQAVADVLKWAEEVRRSAEQAW